MTLPLDLCYIDASPDLAPVTVEVRTGDEPMVITTSAGKVRARPGTADHPDVVMSGPPQLVIAALAGRIGLDEASKRGLSVEGDPAALARIKPA
jgi:hypothetical protein